MQHVISQSNMFLVATDFASHSHNLCLIVDQVGIPELYHFVYKSKSTAQYTSPELEAPYVEAEEQERYPVLLHSLTIHRQPKLIV